jgi:hypothetical protein
MTDLFVESKPDLKAMREAERQRAAEEREKKETWKVYSNTMAHAQVWACVRDRLLKLLIEGDGSDRLALLYHHAINRTRVLDEQALRVCLHMWHPHLNSWQVEQRLDSFEIGDPGPRGTLEGITAFTVGKQIARYLNL